MIAALYVETDGCYFGLDGVDPWDAERDARGYPGPHPVVAHPPCKRWGRYWSGGPSARVRRHLGDDLGCFASALWAVRTFGGVLEHPEASKAWEYFGLKTPPRSGSWVWADALGAWTCCVEQGHYGHKARKATWLYYRGAELPPELIWGPCDGKQRMDAGFHSAAERARATEGQRSTKRLSAQERLATPVPFRDLLISIARKAGV
jgi:hypothetical protein